MSKHQPPASSKHKTLFEYRDYVMKILENIEKRVNEINGRVRENERKIGIIRGVGIATTFIIGVVITIFKVF